MERARKPVILFVHGYCISLGAEERPIRREELGTHYRTILRDPVSRRRAHPF